MRLNLNLASQPYEDVSRFYRTWGALMALVGVITLILLGLSLSSLYGAYTIGKQTSALRAQIEQLDHQKKAVEELLNRPENRDTRDRSRFINSLIARKAFSWTQVFTDLEKIMPARVHVVAIEPKVSEDSQIHIQMRVETDSREKTVELVRRMEQSRSFRQAQVMNETAQAIQNSVRTIQFEIAAVYVPHVGTATPEPAQAGQGGSQ
jgi:type IV pilus assembly protein PilN